MNQQLKIVAFASSNRRGSLNRRLLAQAVEAVEAVAGTEVEVDVIDLRSLPLPLYDADLQDRDGMPRAAHEIHDRIAAADAVLVANPEYNGGYPALFKNLIDWVSRIDMFVFHPRYVGLLSATPGKGGGSRGVEHTRALFENIFVTSHPEAFTLSAAQDALGDDGWTSDDEAARMSAWAQGFVEAAAAHAAARTEAA